jgi:ribosomal protein S12 methylthiotransferase accessory factor
VVCQTSSTGMAAGPTRNAAIERGLLELIERDALNLAWFSKVAPSVVGFDALDSVAPRQRAVVEKTRASLRLREHRTDVPGIHVVSAVDIREDRDSYGLCLGHAAASDVGVAAADAIGEVVQIRQRYDIAALHPRWSYAQAVTAAMPPPGEDDPRRLTAVLGGIAYYGNPANLSKALPYLLGPEEDLAERSQRCEPHAAPSSWTARDAVRSMGIDPIIVDFDVPRSRFVQSRVPACVVKVVVPELTHGNLPGYPKLGHPRLRSFPYTIGVTEEPLRYADLNDLLYPYM